MKALITGASSGIGRDMARNLSKRGYDLILVARDENRLQELKKELEIYKVNIEIIAMDLAIEENCKELHKKVKDIDFLINNAGFGLFGIFTEADLTRELEMIDLNIKAYHILTKLFLQDFVKKNKGEILNVASSAAFEPGPLMSTYYATKSYVYNLTMGIYEELRRSKSKVKIHVLCPGPVDTGFNDRAHVKFGVKSLKSIDVVKYTLRCMAKNKLIIIPGFTIKLGVFANRILPRKLVIKVTYKIQKSKELKEK